MKERGAIEGSCTLNLRQQVRRPLDGSRDQMREKADEQRIVQKVFGGFKFAFVDVDDVGHFLERVKRDCRWQNDLEERMRDSMHTKHIQGVYRGVEKEIQILEVCEKTEVHYQRQDKQTPTLSGILNRADSLTDNIVNHRGCRHEQKKPPVPPSVEDVAGGQKHYVLATVSQTPIDGRNQDQECEIDGGIKQQGSFFSNYCKLNRLSFTQ